MRQKRWYRGAKFTQLKVSISNLLLDSVIDVLQPWLNFKPEPKYFLDGRRKKLLEPEPEISFPQLLCVGQASSTNNSLNWFSMDQINPDPGMKSKF